MARNLKKADGPCLPAIITLGRPITEPGIGIGAHLSSRISALPQRFSRRLSQVHSCLPESTDQSRIGFMAKMEKKTLSDPEEKRSSTKANWNLSH
jgi:hypothetical protein